MMNENEQTALADRAARRRLTGTMLMAVIFGLAIWNLIVSLMEYVVTPWLGTILSQNAGLPPSFTGNYDYPDMFIAIIEFCLAGIVAVSLNWLLQRPNRTREKRFQPIIPAVPPSSVSAAPAQRALVSEPVMATPRIEVTPQAVPVPASTRTVGNYWVPPVSQTPAPARAQVAATPDVQRVPAVERPVVSPTAPPPSTPRTAAVEKPAAAAAVAIPQSVSDEPEAPKASRVEAAKPKKEKQVYYNIVGEPITFDED